jgi:hypothetical protein
MGWVLAQGDDPMAWPRGHCVPERWLGVHDTCRRVVTAAVAAAGTPTAPSPWGLLRELKGGSGVTPGKVVGGEAHQGGLSTAADGDEAARWGFSTATALRWSSAVVATSCSTGVGGGRWGVVQRERKWWRGQSSSREGENGGNSFVFSGADGSPSVGVDQWSPVWDVGLCALMYQM